MYRRKKGSRKFSMVCIVTLNLTGTVQFGDRETPLRSANTMISHYNNFQVSLVCVFVTHVELGDVDTARNTIPLRSYLIVFPCLSLQAVKF